MATYQELRTRSQQVRDEQNIGGNTALRVGQLLMDIVKYFYDNDAAASEYLQQHFAMVNDGTHLLNWQQSPIVILHTMGETYDEGDFSALSQGENYYRAGFIMEANGQGGGINGETPKANVLYVNLANDTLYTWNGASFDAITSGGGGSISGDDIIKNAYYSNGNLVLVIETESGDKTVSIPVNFDASNYVPTSRTVNGKALSNNITLSQSDIPGLVAALAAKVGYSDDEWLRVKAGAMQAATAVPNTTTVNGKRLNDNIVIGMADIPGLETAIGEAGKVKTVSVNNGTPAQPDSNGNVNIQVQTGSTISPATATPSMDGTANVGSSAKYAREDHVHPHDTSKLSKSDVSVETQGDGTVDINVKDDTYTINLNHTHENMAKLIVCEESDLPSTLDNSAIYVITDSGETEIEKLIIRGMEFAGGGVPDTGEPMISSPSNGSTINLGTNEGSGVSKTITIKGKNLTGDLTVAVGTGLTISYGQALDASRVTIPMAQALLGAQVTIAYSGTGALDDGSLVIRQGNDVLSSVVVIVELERVALTAIKLTGTQWLQTDYYPNANTEFEMELKFTANSYTNSLQSVGNGIFLLRASNDTGSNRWDLNHGNISDADLWKLVMHLDKNAAGTNDVTANNHALFTADHTIIKLVKTSSTKATFYFAGTVIGEMSLKSGTTSLPLAIGYNYQFENSGPIYKAFDLTIYRLTITENGSTVRNYVPVTYQGVPGLYDEVNDRFISSKTESELVAVE